MAQTPSIPLQLTQGRPCALQSNKMELSGVTFWSRVKVPTQEISIGPLRHTLLLWSCGFNWNELFCILPTTQLQLCDLRFQFVRTFTDSWAQTGFSLNTVDPAFHETGPRQALLRAPVEPGANKHVLPSPQPTQTSAIEFQNSTILRGTTFILNRQRQLKKKTFRVKNVSAHQIGLMRERRLGKTKTGFSIVIFQRN